VVSEIGHRPVSPASVPNYQKSPKPECLNFAQIFPANADPYNPLKLKGLVSP
jgi:hypothetical protein